MTHILVTGSSGTIGTELVLQLLDRGYEVTGVDIGPNVWSDRVDDRTVELDLREENLVEKLPVDVDFIVHLAANARVYKLIEAPTKARDNFVTTFNALEYAREVEADLVFSSSREVYGNRQKIIHSEDDTLVDDCESPYTASKMGGEALVESYANCYDIRTSILRFSNVYGRYDLSDRVVPLFIAQAKAGHTLTIYGGEKLLDFTYIEDCVNGVIAVLENFRKSHGTTFNIASGSGSSLVELAEIVCETTDSGSSIEIDESRTGEVARYIANTEKARRVLGFKPTCDLESGIRKTVEWYEEHDLYEEILELNDW